MIVIFIRFQVTGVKTDEVAEGRDHGHEAEVADEVEAEAAEGHTEHNTQLPLTTYHHDASKHFTGPCIFML